MVVPIEEKRTQEWWDIWFLKLAQYVSTASKDPSTKVGAVLTNGNEVVKVGYNGFAPGIMDYEERYLDRETKLLLSLHAEENAIRYAKKDLTGHTIYTFPFMPCSKCAALICAEKISRVVSINNFSDRWKTNFDWATQQFLERGVELVIYDIGRLE